MKKICEPCTKFQNPSQCNYYFQELIKQSKIISIKYRYFQIYVGEHLGNPQFRKPIKMLKITKYGTARVLYCSKSKNKVWLGFSSIKNPEKRCCCGFILLKMLKECMAGVLHCLKSKSKLRLGFFFI